MKQLLKVAVIALSICYPFMVYWGLQYYDARLLLPLLLILLALRWLTGTGLSEHKVVIVTLLMGCLRSNDGRTGSNQSIRIEKEIERSTLIRVIYL